MLVLLIICTIAVSFSKNLLVSVVIYMAFSLVMSIIWLILESPDLAITEARNAWCWRHPFFVTLKKIRLYTNDGRERTLMSKKNPNYRNSFADKFTRWVKGDYDPIVGQMEMNAPDTEVFGDERIRYVHLHIVKSNNYSERMFEEGHAKNVRRFTGLYKVFGAIVAIFIACLLLWTVSYLPKFGDPNAPENNEVATRYIEQGLSETGAVNIVTGMILDYRAFDTFGESCVLFVASCCVLILLRVDKDEDPESRAIEDMNDRHYEPRNDTIL